jgi:hypothetical protein
MNQPLGRIDPLHFLTVADLDYVAARSLLLSGLMLPGNAKAAEAIEKMLKICLICESGIRTGQPLPQGNSRNVGPA